MWLCLTIHDTLEIGREHQYKNCPTWQLKLINPTQLPLIMFYMSQLHIYYAYFCVQLKRCICIRCYHYEKIDPQRIKKPMVKKKKKNQWFSNLLIYLQHTCLTHLPLVPHICINKLGHHWFRQWLVACPAPSHYWNQCWLIVIWIPGNKFHWNLTRNSTIFIQQNAFENVGCQKGSHFVLGEMSQCT